MNKFVAKSIQGTAYEPGSDENKKKNEDENTKKEHRFGKFLALL